VWSAPQVRRITQRILGVLLAACFLPTSASSAARRTITFEDCVGTRRLGYDDRPMLVLAPDGQQVAFVVKAPNLKTNRNDYILYVRLLSLKLRSNGRLLARHDKIAELKWLGDSKTIVLLAKDLDRSYIELINVDSGKAVHIPSSENVASYSVDSSGHTFAFTVPVSRKSPEQLEQAETFGFPVVRGTVIDLDNSFPEYMPRFRIYFLKRSNRVWTRRKALLAFGGGPVTEVFESVTGINLSPDGKYITFSYVPDKAVPSWAQSRLTQWLVSRGFRPSQLILYEVQSGQARLGINAPQASPFATVWSDDSKAFSISSIAPLGSAWEKRDAAAGFDSGIQWASFSHLYTVDASTGDVAEVLTSLANWNENGIAVWSENAGPMLVHLDAETFVWMMRSSAGWIETRRIRFSIPELNASSGWSANGRVIVGVREGLMTPPELALYDLSERSARVLTDLNPEYRTIDLGVIEQIEWRDQHGEPCGGFLIKPVGYQQGLRYPVVVMSKGWVSNFFYTDTFHRTAFAPQSLAAAGFMVLLATRPSSFQDFHRKGYLAGYPGQLGEVYEWMSMVESGISTLDERGLVDTDLVGIAGFSRTSWYVDFMLTHSDFRFAAASSADSGLYNYGGYWLWNTLSIAEDSEAQMGGPPYGASLKNWLEYSPAFNADRVSAPVLMEYTRETPFGPIAAYEFFTALHRQGKTVELVYYPRGEHELDTPLERLASLRRNVDWFRFWIQGYEGRSPAYDPGQFARWRTLRDRRTGVSK
jgi:dipeptidyl aminopeptidase/acylaminoacyl peptidase